jgi:hypothetical protein
MSGSDNFRKSPESHEPSSRVEALGVTLAIGGLTIPIVVGGITPRCKKNQRDHSNVLVVPDRWHHLVGMAFLALMAASTT